MDPELKTILSALVEGQVKLAEGQVRLAEGQARTDAAVRALAGEVRKIATEQRKLTGAQRRTEERIGGLAQRVIRGFTGVAKRKGAAGRRLARLERAR